MTENYERLIKLLKELFQIDRPDLDFGIYRIMNQKREDITYFLDKELLPQVKEAFASYGAGGRSDIQAELDAVVKQARELGADPETLSKVKALREKLSAAVDVTELENEVYSHLFNFFRRYYKDGDFLSLRRYKKDVYAIPYEGEEVKLHWANADQYYIKSSENFRDYTFKLGALPGEGKEDARKKVHFKLVEADTEVANKKMKEGMERRFVLNEANPITEENDELYIRFDYLPFPKTHKQGKFNEIAVETILGSTELAKWTRELAREDGDKPLLAKHLKRYTDKSAFDYFIHKDLGELLRRELDFFIKNEVMHLDDIEEESAPKVEQYLCLIKVIRHIARKLIRFLEHLENFQKKLWLKKKFVVQTNYCITLDRISEELYPEICANNAQRKEWIKLFAIDEINKDLINPGYTNPLTSEFLKENSGLLLDTRFFDEEFKRKLISTIDGLDEQCNGVLINSENYQALRLLRERFTDNIKCVYIDPPYNTGGDGFAYKDNYQHSSWLSMISDRLRALHPLLHPKGVVYSSIDAVERNNLAYVMNDVFKPENRVEEIIWVQNTTKNQSPTYSTNHEYVEVYAKDIAAVKADYAMFRESKPGFIEIMELVEGLTPKYPPISEIEVALRKLYKNHKDEVKKQTEETGEEVLDEWKGIYNYKYAEYRTEDGQYVEEIDAKKLNAKIWVWREDNPSMPQVKEDSQKSEFRDPENPAFRFYTPKHPITGKSCPHPKRGWSWPYNPLGNQRFCFSELTTDRRIAWGKDELKIPQTKRFLHEVETNVSKSVINDYTDGEKELTNIFGQTRAFGGPKPTTLMKRFCEQTNVTSEYVCDFFAGSGTTGESVIRLNREDGKNRKYILIEMGDHFEGVLKPRIAKVIYSADWKNGKPVDHKPHLSHCIKYMTFESYEDTLNNLSLKRSNAQTSLLNTFSSLKEEYMLSYMMDLETESSASLLNVDRFDDPWNYTMKIATGSAGETKVRPVDLVETFNYLIGLTVIRRDFLRNIEVIEGTNPDGEKALVIWRNTKKTSNEQLDEFFRKQEFNSRDTEFDLIYVNGDNNLENLKRPDETWKVRLIEEDFKRLMFDVEDI